MFWPFAFIDKTVKSDRKEEEEEEREVDVHRRAEDGVEPAADAAMTMGLYQLSYTSAPRTFIYIEYLLQSRYLSSHDVSLAF